MNGLPYYKAYPRDFFEGTAGMPFELKATYRLVLDLIYMHGGKLADDPRFIAGHLGCSVRAWNQARAKLIEAGKIVADLGIISNFRADKELETLRTFQYKQRENASKPRKNNNIREAVAEQKPSHTEPDTDKKKEETSVSSQKARRRPELPIPENWVPSERNIADAEARQLSAQRIDDEAERFRDYHLARGSRFRDWDAAWRTWIGNALKFAASRGGNSREAPGDRQLRLIADAARGDTLPRLGGCAG